MPVLSVVLWVEKKVNVWTEEKLYLQWEDDEVVMVVVSGNYKVELMVVVWVDDEVCVWTQEDLYLCEDGVIVEEVVAEETHDHVNEDICLVHQQQ